ncbi:MAG: hypothetical protein ABIR96_13020 [Bdellovibrionota bacterium]
MSDSDLLITIGTIVRPHGFPREGVSYFKAAFDFSGHEILPTQKTVWIADGNSFVEFALAETSAPLGGKWSHATGAKVAFFETDLAKLVGKVEGRALALKRSVFPQLGPDEVYICDLLGAELRDENGQSYGRIEGSLAMSKDSWNLVARGSHKNAKPFEFPFKWVDWKASQISGAAETRFLVVPNVSIWVDIESLEGERDDD